MTQLHDQIKTRGYWRIIIRPVTFEDRRINTLAKCKELVRECSVQYRGWDYPHFDTNEGPTNGLDCVEQSCGWLSHLEIWRYWQSGQFAHVFGLWEDWLELRTIGTDWEVSPGETLSVLSAVYLCTEVYEFAARLTMADALGAECKITIELHNTMNRRLSMFNPARDLSGEYRTALSSIPYSCQITAAKLVADPRSPALEHAAWIMERFNWEPFPRSIFRKDQENLIRGRA